MLITQTSRDDWLEGVFLKSNSENSRNSAIKALKKWDLFLKEKHPDKTEELILRELNRLKDSPDVYNFLNQFTQFLTLQKISARTVRLYFMFIKSWLRNNGIRLNNDDIKQFVRFPKYLRELRRPLTKEMISLLLTKSPPRLKALLLSLTSSGARLSELLQLRMKDIDFSKDPIEINIRAETTKTREERISYLSMEAVAAINKLAKDKLSTDVIFTSSFNKGSILNVEIRFRNARRRAGLDAKYANGMHHVNLHAFRAYFHTQATKVLGGDIAHALIGHHTYLDQYFRLSPEERALKYKELEPFVTIGPQEAPQQAI